MASNVPLCGVCDCRHMTKQAVIWCNDCDEGLCGECQDHHRSSKGSGNHDTVNIEDYTMLPIEIRNTGSLCPIHTESYTTYCRKHDCPCCKICVIKSHDKCGELADINNVIGSVKSSGLFKSIEDAIDSIEDSLRKMNKYQKDSIKTMTSRKTKIEDEIRQVRKTINDHLDKIQMNLINQLADQYKKDELAKQKSISLLEDKEKRFCELKSNLSKIKAHASNIQTYVTLKEIERRCDEESRYVQSVAGSIDFKQVDFSFKVDDAVTNFREKYSGFGEIVVERRPIDSSVIQMKSKQAQLLLSSRIKSVDYIKLVIKKTTNTRIGMISGCTLLPGGRMVFADSLDGSLQFFKNDGTKKFRIKIAFRVYDLFFNKEDGTILVIHIHDSLGGKSISVVDVEQRIIKKTIPCDKETTGITVNKGSVVYCVRDGIKMIRLIDGTKTTILRQSCSYNSRVAVFNENLYYTNNNSVTSCDFQGNKEWVFENETILKSPFGISVDNNGFVFVVGQGSQNVIVISQDGKHFKEILNKDNGLYAPTALHIDDEMKRLLVTNIKNKAFLFCVS